MVAAETAPTLGDAVYAALGLSRPRLRFMALFTAVVSLLPIGLALVSEPKTASTAVVDITAFTESGTPAFEVQSLTDQFLDALSSPAAVEATAAEVDLSTDELREALSGSNEDGATRVTVTYTDVDGERAEEVAIAAARNALRDLAGQRVASASRDVSAATARLAAAEAALAAFETEVGVRNIPSEYAQLSDLIEQLTTDLPTSSNPGGTQAQLDLALAQRGALENAVRRAESLEAERGGAQDQLLAANEQLSQAQSQVAAADAAEVVRPGFSTTGSRLPDLVTAAGSGILIGVLASYALTALAARRRRADTPDR